MQVSSLAQELGASAAASQRTFIALNRAQLILIVTAAVFAALPLTLPGRDLNWPSLVAAVCFGLSLLLRVMLFMRGDEDIWRAARIDAEEAKSLCYRYAFGATGYEFSGGKDAARRRFIEDASRIGESVVLTAVLPIDAGYEDITTDMAEVRGLDHAQMRQRYLTERIIDQERWYTLRAAQYLRRSRMWLTFMVVAEAGGLIFGLLAVFRSAPEGAVGLMSAIAAASLAWSQLRQFSVLSRTYSRYAVHLRDLARRVPLVPPEEWPAFVTRVEDALEAEHAAWRRIRGEIS
ncbi:MAG: DUF4231 domain-containing protein [Microbacterium sp.]